MPLYEYKCLNCQEISEFNQKMSDPPPVACPLCQHTELQKVMSRTAFHLKGGGWYSDLYSAQKPKADSDTKKTEAKSESTSDSAKSTTTETKPAKTESSSKTTKSPAKE